MKNQVDLHYNTFFILIITAATTLMTTLAVYGCFTEVPSVEITGYDVLYFILAGLCCFGLTVYLLKVYLIPALKHQNAVVINADVIVDNIKNITIKWEDVKNVRSLTSRNSSYILIYMNNPQEVISSTNNWIKKLIYFYKKLLYGTPVVISTRFISGNNFDILNQFLPFLHKQKQLTTQDL